MNNTLPTTALGFNDFFLMTCLASGLVTLSLADRSDMCWRSLDAGSIAARSSTAHRASSAMGTVMSPTDTLPSGETCPCPFSPAPSLHSEDAGRRLRGAPNAVGWNDRTVSVLYAPDSEAGGGNVEIRALRVGKRLSFPTFNAFLQFASVSIWRPLCANTGFLKAPRSASNGTEPRICTFRPRLGVPRTRRSLFVQDANLSRMLTQGCAGAT
ncbi:MAG: hypothetical protein EOP64_00800 [Sphingomonas sp.]|nr:MAG: hypothetical protein EOP64_00800 [Sphingomonas sp.]